jgi:hypothetical protein
MYATCSECHRLWSELADAITDHLKVLSQYQIAAIMQDSAAVTRLDALVAQTSERRQLARDAISSHEEAIHAARKAATQS